MEKNQNISKKPTGWDYILILVIFAVTGTTAAYFSRLIMPLTGIENRFLYVVVYILLITPIYQVLLLGYAFIFGKYRYFLEKQRKLGRWLMRPFRKKQPSS
jgi:hypothetical protein